MPPDLHLLIRLTQHQLTAGDRRRSLHHFAESNGWRPSDALEEYAPTDGFATGHIVVEHGLENSLVISFLKAAHPLSTLHGDDMQRLLSISYNHLVDIHLIPDLNGAHVLNNRFPNQHPKYISLFETPDIWHATAFDTIARGYTRPELDRLDRTLVNTVSYWKKTLAVEITPAPTNEQISALFNSIIFFRALEDLRLNSGALAAPLLLSRITDQIGCPTVKSVFTSALAQLQDTPLPPVFANDLNALSAFDGVSRLTLTALFQDFYNNRFAGYPMDFSLISKQALSRIYEHYVSLLRETDADSPQLRLWRDLPTEITNRDIGAVYTPQYIARFFARYLRQSTPNLRLTQIRAIDPACGSGIFLRTLLEVICDSSAELLPKQIAQSVFSHFTGIDVDPSACRAAILSLSLLHLALTETLPEALDIINDEAVGHFLSHPHLSGVYDVVVANPPFIPWDRMSDEFRAHITQFMGIDSQGKTDAFLAILKLGMQLVADEGFLLFLLPHSFLLADNAKSLREDISRLFIVHVLADLSSIDVFPGVGTYVILLIIQKRGCRTGERRAAIVRCRDYVGHALEEVLWGRERQTPFYHVFHADQSAFAEPTWMLLPPVQQSIAKKILSHELLSEVYFVREGMVSGLDSVFVRPAKDVARSEREVWRPLLTDREMTRFEPPKQVASWIFFPVIDGRQVSETRLRTEFPLTWGYLRSKRIELEKRGPVRRGSYPWWKPHRTPVFLDRPKLTAPHLAVFPRFCIDVRGRYAVSRAPIVYPREPAGSASLPGHQLLLYALGILNSSVARWQISTTSHKYARDYAMLEPKTLKTLRIPSPATITADDFAAILRLVSLCLDDPSDTSFSRMLDEHVMKLYGFSQSESLVIDSAGIQ